MDCDGGDVLGWLAVVTEVSAETDVFSICWLTIALSFMVREMRWDVLEDLFDFDIEPLAKHQQTASRTNTKIQKYTHAHRGHSLNNTIFSLIFFET